MNVVVCDDERKVIEEVGAICKECLSQDVKIYGFQSSESLLKNIDKIDGDIDLFILDIEMPGKNGLWLRKELERYRYGSSIIYLTSHDELVQEAFGRYVIGFVDKITFRKNKDVLIKKLEMFQQEEQEKEIINIRCDNNSFYIQKDKIVSITAEHVYTYLEYVTDLLEDKICVDKKLIRRSLKDWQQDLGNDFIRVSKSVIVNMNYITRITKILELKTGETINIPRSNLTKIQEQYFDFCKRKMKWG